MNMTGFPSLAQLTASKASANSFCSNSTRCHTGSGAQLKLHQPGTKNCSEIDRVLELRVNVEVQWCLTARCDAALNIIATI